jgi:hypothetical protein
MTRSKWRVKDAIKHLRYGVGGIHRAIDLEKEHEPTLNPFLDGNILQVEVTSTTTGRTVVCDEDGAGIFFRNEGRFCDGETDVKEEVPEVIDVLPGITACDNLSFSQGQSHSALNTCLGKYGSASKTDEDACDRAVFPDGKNDPIRCIHVAHGLHDWEVGGKPGGNGAFRVYGDNVSAREVGTLTTSGAPIHQATGMSGTEITHDVFCCSKMNAGGTFVKLADYRDCRGDVEMSNLDGEYQHAGERALLKSEICNKGELGRWVQRTSGHLQCFENDRGEWYHQWSILSSSLPTKLGETRINI